MNPEPKKVTLSPEPGYQPLLEGPPETRGMRSGRVVLAPGQEMSEHSTNRNEEILVFLEGRAQVTLRGVGPIDMAAGEVLYIPPQTFHEVRNRADRPARYIYTVAPANQTEPTKPA